MQIKNIYLISLIKTVILIKKVNQICLSSAMFRNLQNLNINDQKPIRQQ